jgi:hypothetical protein
MGAMILNYQKSIDHGLGAAMGDPQKDFCQQVFFESTLSLIHKSGCLTFLRGSVFKLWGKSLIFVKIMSENWKSSPDLIKMPLTFANTCILIIHNLLHHMSSCLTLLRSDSYDILGQKRGFLINE